MNWMQIDKELFFMYDKLYNKSPEKFYKEVAKRFNWTARQTQQNTSYIIKMRNKNIS